MKQTNITKSEKQTFNLGAKLGSKLRGGDIVVLVGDLGAGKTVFTKGIAKGLGIKDSTKIKSPTFTLVNEVAGKIPLYHFDLYRLEDPSELVEISFDEYLERNGVVVIEWGDKFQDMIERDFIEVVIDHGGLNKRLIVIKKKSRVL